MLRGFVKGFLGVSAVMITSLAIYAAIMYQHDKGPRCNAQLFNTPIHCTEPVHGNKQPHINNTGYVWPY